MKNKVISLSIGVSLLGIGSTLYLWSFVTGGNHWELFGTPIEQFLMRYGAKLVFFFSGILCTPLLFKRDRLEWGTAFLALPVLSSFIIRYLHF